MRVVMDYTPAVRQGAGIGRHTRQLVAALAALAPAAAAVRLVSYGRAAPAQPAPLPLRRVPLANRWLSAAWYRADLPLPADWLSGGADLYHASDFTLPPLHRARGLLTVHDLSFLTAPQHADAGLRRFLSRAVPHSVARAYHILADSESTRRDLIHLLHADPQRITVVYPGVEARFAPIHDPVRLAAVRARYGLGEQPFVLGLGTLEPRKNWDGLIRAWNRLRRAGLPHPLVIGGGKGWLVQQIEAEAAASPWRDDIHFIGFVDDSDLSALYSAAALFAFPSHYEGFGIPLLEAMACGAAVVCADNSSLPEAAGDAAVLVNAADEAALAAALQRVLEDAPYRSALQTAGFRQARRFTWQAAAQTLWQTYQRCYHA